MFEILELVFQILEHLLYPVIPKCNPKDGNMLTSLNIFLMLTVISTNIAWPLTLCTCPNNYAIFDKIEDLTRVIISYEIYQNEPLASLINLI